MLYYRILHHACDIVNATASILAAIAALDEDPSVMWLYLQSATAVMTEDDPANNADMASVIAILHDLAMNDSTSHVRHIVLITDCAVKTDKVSLNLCVRFAAS